ncbi:MAG: hypothetical protein RL323_464 [Pseudomonadota bacterium]|jgi:hypothetical protein
MQDNQIHVPPSFTELFLQPGKVKPSLPLAEILQRYELCEDMAQMLTDPASELLVKLGVTEADVLHKMRLGLEADGTALSPAEALWVTCRLAELLNWPVPQA